ncbi:hypothetical protein Tco_0420923 [Tanacetum coccineum]
MSPDRVFDFPADEPEPHLAYDFFAPGPLPGYAGNPNNNNGWIEADVPLLGELGVVADELMVGLIVDEIVKPIVEAEEQVIAPVVDMDEDIAMLFGDDDFEDDDSEGFDEEEVWEVNEEWLMAPATPPPMPWRVGASKNATWSSLNPIIATGWGGPSPPRGAGGGSRGGFCCVGPSSYWCTKDTGFSKWLEVHALASKSKGKSNHLLLQSLRAKFKWVLTQAKKLGVPPPPELSTFGILVDDKKRKRSSEILQEVFVKEKVVVDGMHQNLVPTPGVEEEEFHLATTPQLIRLQNGILKGTPEVEEFFKKLELTIEARDDTSAGIKGLAECKASTSNLRRIQVKDIVKEVEDHLKTYSSAEMDISWYVEGIRCGSKESQRWHLLLCRTYKGLEYHQYGLSKDFDTTYWGFLGVGTTFDIFQNLHILNLEYSVLDSPGYGVLILFPSWSLVKSRHGYAVSSLMDTAYWINDAIKATLFEVIKYPPLESYLSSISL